MAKPRMDLTAFVGKLLEEQDGDVLREGIRVLSHALRETEVAGLIGAGDRGYSRRKTSDNANDYSLLIRDFRLIHAKIRPTCRPPHSLPAPGSARTKSSRCSAWAAWGRCIARRTRS